MSAGCIDLTIIRLLSLKIGSQQLSNRARQVAKICTALAEGQNCAKSNFERLVLQLANHSIEQLSHMIAP
jgi:hypothetical protein